MSTKHYYVASMYADKPEARHTIAWRHGMVSLQQRNTNSFAVRYGREVDSGLDYAEAAAKLGQALMHQMTCDGELLND